MVYLFRIVSNISMMVDKMNKQKDEFKFSPGVTEAWFLPEYPDRPVYAVIPRRYDPEKPIGLFFFMHGGDASSPPEQPFKLYINEKSGVLQPHIADIPFITVAPAALTAIDGKRWNRHGVVEYILAVIEDACSKFNIDRDRIILGGHSMGGFGAYHNAPLLADKLAGVLLSAGAWLEEDFRGCLGTPLYIMHGKWDCAYHYRGGHCEPRHHDWCGVSFARAAHELMLQYDIEHIYDEHTGGHSLEWEPCQLAFKRFLRWAARQKRNPYASRCAVVMPNGAKDPDLENINRSRWLEITETSPGNITLDKIVLTGPNIAWTVDELEAQSFYLSKSEHPGSRITGENLGNNRFTFTAENISSFTCRLHPEMADLSKELYFTVNGKEYRVTPEADTTHPDYTAKVQLVLN